MNKTNKNYIFTAPPSLHFQNAAEIFFAFLETCNLDFRFYIYLNHTEKASWGKAWIEQMLSRYGRILGEKLAVRSPLPRLELIYELSKNDFLVDFSNLVGTPRTSKLIDYALTGRPVLSMNAATFRPEIFHQFIHADFSQSVEVDLSEHDIDHAVEQYLKAGRQSPVPGFQGRPAVSEGPDQA